MTLKDNAMASTVSHAENCLYDIKTDIEDNGSVTQKVALEVALNALETLYFSLRNED
jgi:hypothetical protein